MTGEYYLLMWAIKKLVSITNIITIILLPFQGHKFNSYYNLHV